MSNITTLHSDLTINEIIRLSPAAVGPLHAAGLDSCCRGNESLATAASNAGIDPQRLLADIVALADQKVVVPANACACTTSTRENA